MKFLFELKLKWAMGVMVLVVFENTTFRVHKLGVVIRPWYDYSYV